MAESERSTTEGDGKPVKRREELDQLLHRIAAHIADVDRQAPPAGPDAGAPDDEAATDAAEPPLPAEPPHAAPAASPPAISLRRSPSVEPPALRSALNRPASPAAQSPLLPRTRPVGGIEPAAPAAPPSLRRPRPEPAATETASEAAVRPEAPAAGGPWDRAAADALADTTAPEAAVPPLRGVLEHMAGMAGAGQPARTGPAGRIVTAPLEEAADAEGDARRQLMEAARRVEAALDGLAPRAVVEDLGRRFASLEGEVGRSSLKLARLDGIEAKLGELGSKLSDEQVIALFGSLVPTADELTRFAEDAAGRAAERVLEAQSQQLSGATAPRDNTGTLQQVKALSDLVAEFMDDRRRSDAGTIEALETLQLAMQHLLDRVEQMDRTQTAEAAAVDPAAALASELHEPEARFAHGRAEPVAPVGPHPAIVAPSLVEPSRAMTTLGAARAAAEPQPVAPVSPPPFGDMRPRDLDATLDAHQYDDPPTARMPAGPDTGASSSTAGAAAAAAFRGLTSDARPQAGDPRTAAQPTDRQAFIAMARKAAERASAQQAAQAQAEKAPRRSAPKPAEASAASGQAHEAPLEPGLTTRLTAGVRPGVLAIAGIAVLVLAGYWYVAGPKLRLFSASAPVVSEQSAPAQALPQRKSPTRSQPDVESEGEPAPRTPPVEALPSPSRTTDDGAGRPGLEDRQEASLEAPSDLPSLGIAIADSRAGIDQVLQARERDRIARLSQRAAFSAAQMHAVPPGSSSIETAALPTPAAKPEATQAAETSRQLVLPPATTGPLSLRVAAAQGEAAAQLEIATRLAEGKGTKQNFAEAAVWYERAAEQGEAVAQYRLGTLLERGMGVKADRDQAKVWYQRSADLGNLKAMHNLAVMVASPASGAPDYASAAQLFSRAAGHGLADSQYNLGVLYESGLGLPKDHAAAYKWYTLAARGGDQDAARRRDLLISRLPAETIQAMEAQIARWRPAPSSERANKPGKTATPAARQRSVEAAR